LSLSIVLWLSACGRDAPTQAKSQPATAPEELAGLAVALEDVRIRILPTLATDPAAEALGSALGQLELALSQPEAAVLEGALGRARAAAARLWAEPSLMPDVDVVLLLLERIDVVLHGSAEPDVQEATGTRRDS
jgi:hypothetical protein